MSGPPYMVIHLQCGVLLTSGASGLLWCAYAWQKVQMWEGRRAVIGFGQFLICAAGYRAVPNVIQPGPICFNQKSKIQKIDGQELHTACFRCC